MKTCFKCKKEKPVSEFYRHPMMADGRLGKCKECTKSDVSNNYRRNIDHYKKYERSRATLPHRLQMRGEYAATPRGRAAYRRAKEKWTNRNKEARAAHVILGNAVRAGRVKKMPCVKCGSKYRIHGHHEDYAKPLDVIWLCAKHHRERHNNSVNI